MPVRVRLTASAARELNLARGSRAWIALRSRSFRLIG
jgi:hypothetical protein